MWTPDGCDRLIIAHIRLRHVRVPDLPRVFRPLIRQLSRQKMFQNFLKMGTRDRLRLVIFVLIAVGAVLLWPILFCLKVDDRLSASWVALWIPLWIYDALGELLRGRYFSTGVRFKD